MTPYIIKYYNTHTLKETAEHFGISIHGVIKIVHNHKTKDR